ncbi:MAG: toprim domain-containing protein, partial [Methylococcaceae bacterium]
MSTTSDAAKLFAPWLVGNESDGEHRAFCPLHEDPKMSRSPSASFNFKGNLFQCFAGCGGLSLSALTQLLRDDGSLPTASGRSPRGRKPVSEDEPDAAKLPTEEFLDDAVDRLLANAVNMKVMREKRGLTLETIEKFGIGFHDGRFLIPVRDAQGRLVNVRRYKPNATEPKDKMKSWRPGTGSRRLFLPEVLDAHEEVILVEGEMDAIIGQQYGLPTLSHTAGATAWDSRWNLDFEGKVVFICYDCDDTGRRGARKVEGQLQRYAKKVHVISLPLKDKGADLTNYFVDQGHTAKDFRVLMEEARSYVSRSAYLGHIRAQEPKVVTLERSMDGRYHEMPL